MINDALHAQFTIHAKKKKKKKKRFSQLILQRRAITKKIDARAGNGSQCAYLWRHLAAINLASQEGEYQEFGAKRVPC